MSAGSKKKETLDTFSAANHVHFNNNLKKSSSSGFPVDQLHVFRGLFKEEVMTPIVKSQDSIDEDANNDLSGMNPTGKRSSLIEVRKLSNPMSQD